MAAPTPVGEGSTSAPWWRAPELWLLALLSLAYAPMFWGQIIFFRDPAHWNYPARALVRKALLSGQFPHWNPFTGLGLPVWGNPLYGVFYPPNWLLLLVPDNLLANALTWQSFGHTFFGGWGIIVLARQFGCGRGACLLGGLTWSLGGYTTSMWSAGLLLIPGAWLPWVAVGLIAAVTCAREQRMARAMLCAGLPVASIWLTGEPFIAFMAMGFGLLTALAWHAHAENKVVAPARLRQLMPLVAGWLCAMLVAAIVVLPARAVLSQSPRAHGVSRAESELYSLHPLRMIEFIAPESFGLPAVDYPGGKYVGEAAIDGMPLAFSTYFGAGAFALALIAFGRRRKFALVLGCCWLFVLLLAFGRHTPLHGLWRWAVLPFGYMRYPEKYVVMLVGWISLLAALGVQRISGGPAPWKRAAGLLGGVIAAMLLCSSFADPKLAHHLRGGLLRGAMALGILLALIWLRRKRPSVFVPALCALVFVDLAPIVWNLQPFAPGHMVLGTPPVVEAILNQQEPDALPRVYRHLGVSDTVAALVKADTISDWESRWLQTLTPNFGSSFGIATVPGYDAATSSRFEALWAEGRGFGATTLRLLSVDYAILPVARPLERDVRVGEHYTPIMDPLPGARLYKVAKTLPKAYVAPAAAVMNDKQTLHAMFTPEVANGELAIVAEGQGFAPIPSPKPATVTVCDLQRPSWSQLKAVCDAKTPGVAVFVEQYDPGWRALVNGQAAPVLRVNQALRGVALGAGRQVVELRYHPPGALLGALLTLLGTLGFALALVFTLRSKSKKGPKAPVL